MWIKRVKDCGILCFDDFFFINILGELVKIRVWNILGFFIDNFFLENGIILA